MTKNPRSLALSAFAAVALGLIGYWGLSWWIVGRHTENTNNAYVRADITTVSARVEGQIEDVLVDDNQRVAKGDLLARIQQDAFKARLAQGVADLEKAEATTKAIDSKLTLQGSLIEEAQADLDAVMADQALAIGELERAKGLMAENATSAQRYDISVAEDLRARAKVAGARAHLAAARTERDILDMERWALTAEAGEKTAALDLLNIDLAYTEVRAPIDGIVGNRSVRTGQFVRPGMHLMALVPTDTPWIVANFKETQLTRMHPGQPVEVTVDTYPDVVLNGRIESVSPASGAEFSLLPPENATGNFSKIVQRVPIKIVLPDGHALKGLLRPGMSVIVNVDTREGERSLGSGALASDTP
ncbi:MAG: HlyD family secretion protein [Rhodospirillaceae bacterium]|jgi:membrane fusion protein, multidrug efflux system|nr:HlyD family secretion protein [Rhodospirillaceae bacterium]MBT5565580.1 HlyD family secretion protein [Rhodospirillaceae bacterium]MBT6088349.1 HlyD family secretion protein [Rhodospirillaceae bacterium]MBT7451505.1 HlyD family secretion protein [Rhodospirillaceae bacterium]